MPRTPKRASGLWKNGARWWVRVPQPSTGAKVPVSTGTADLALANRVVAMLEEFGDDRSKREILEQIATRSLTLADTYDAYASGRLPALLDRAHAPAEEPDLRKWVDKWLDEHVSVLVRSNRISASTCADYLRQVRALIPAGAYFPASKLTEDYCRETLGSLVDPRSGQPLTGSTQRRYIAAWRLFIKWARRRVPLASNPLEDADWLPSNNAARSTHWEHKTVRAVLDAMTGEARVAMALVFGTGMELGAVQALKGRHVVAERRILASGTKNEYREREVFVDAWAWAIVKPHVTALLPLAPMFTITEAELRESFYEAQVQLGLVAKPPKSESYKKLWKQVRPHTIHDARHTYAITRLLGLDGEPRQSMKFVAHQLGHADEQMVSRIYAKVGGEHRLRLLELAEAQQTATAVGGAK